MVSTSLYLSRVCFLEKCLLATIALFRMTPRIVDGNLSMRFLAISNNYVQSDTYDSSSHFPSWPCSLSLLCFPDPSLFHPSNRHDHFHADTTRAVSWRGPLRRNTRKARHCTSMMLTCNVADCNVLQRCKKPCGAASHLVARKSLQSFPATKENPFTSTSNEFHRLLVQISAQHRTPYSGQD